VSPGVPLSSRKKTLVPGWSTASPSGLTTVSPSRVTGPTEVPSARLKVRRDGSSPPRFWSIFFATRRSGSETPRRSEASFAAWVIIVDGEVFPQQEAELDDRHHRDDEDREDEAELDHRLPFAARRAGAGGSCLHRRRLP
jgi:hypothetical protein